VKHLPSLAARCTLGVVHDSLVLVKTPLQRGVELLTSAVTLAGLGLLAYGVLRAREHLSVFLWLWSAAVSACPSTPRLRGMPLFQAMCWLELGGGVLTALAGLALMASGDDAQSLVCVGVTMTCAGWGMLIDLHMAPQGPPLPRRLALSVLGVAAAGVGLWLEM
jgi:hypothetical protein